MMNDNGLYYKTLYELLVSHGITINQQNLKNLYGESKQDIIKKYIRKKYQKEMNFLFDKKLKENTINKTNLDMFVVNFNSNDTLLLNSGRGDGVFIRSFVAGPATHGASPSVSVSCADMDDDTN